MTISKEASDLINEFLKKRNKDVLAFNYNKEDEKLSISILTKAEAKDYILLDGVLVKFFNDAKEATLSWTIVEQNGKITINKKCKCCTDDCCEYVCNKVETKCCEEED